MVAAPTSLRAPVGTKRIFYFDLTRGLAAQLVVLGHLLNICYPQIFMPETNKPFYIQSFAVVIFFVLSGYLIASAVMRKGSDPSYTLGRYMIDRTARVLFPMFVALVLIITVDWLVFGGTNAVPFRRIDLSPSTIVQSFLMTFNHPAGPFLARETGISELAVRTVGTGAPLWTVVIEWWIYVAFGIVALVIARRKRLGLFGLLALLFAAAVPISYMAEDVSLPIAWLIGMGYAFASEQLAAIPRRVHAWVAVLSLIVFVKACDNTGFNLEAAATVVPAAVGFCSLYFLLRGRGERFFQLGAPTRLVHFVSDFSYSLYLIHFSLVTYLWVWLHEALSGWQLILIGFAASNFAAIAFYFLVERHHHKVGRWMKRTLPTSAR